MKNLSALFDRLEDCTGHLYGAAAWYRGETLSRRFEPSNNCNNSYSIAKTFTMTAVGMLYDEGKLRPSDFVYDIMREDFPADFDEKWREVTVDHVLRHRIGFSEGFLDIDWEDASLYPTDDYLSIVLSHAIDHRPGTFYAYSDAAFYLLSRIVEKISGERTDDFLRIRLFNPLRFRETAWSRCPMGHPMGATGLYITDNDMLKLALLYLRDGICGGKRYLSEEWCRLAKSREYELHPMADGLLTGKGGMYGQLLVFSEKEDFAFALHRHSEDDHGEVQEILREFLLLN